jgi:predicted dehydrogenase
MGIVGTGMIGNFHAEAIRSLETGKLVAACDVVEDRVNAFADKHGCKGYTSVDAMLADDEIDVVTIATPSGFHLEPAVAAAQAGKHTIIEKPIEITLDRIDRILEAHDKAGTSVGGVFNSRFARPTRLFKQAVDAGRFGRLTFGMAYGPWWRDQAYYDTGGWKGTWKLDGGGAMMNQGIHTIDMLQYLMGPVKNVSARTATLAHANVEVEDTAAVSLEFANGALGAIACTTSMWPGHFRIIEVAGDAGTAAMSEDNFIFWQFKDETDEDNKIRDELLKFPAVSAGASDPSAGLTCDLHRENFASFLASLDAKQPPPISGREARKAVEIILAAYKSAREGCVVSLPL